VKKSLAVFILLLLPTVGWAEERVKIGFIDIQRAISESSAGQKARERFQVQIKKVEADLLKEKHELERLKSEMDKKGPLLKEEERRSMEMDLQRRYVGYQRTMQDSQQDLRQREGALTADILKDLEKVVNEVGKAEKFTLILERSQVLYSDQGIDITNKVLELYNIRTAGKAPQPK
jgi:outer membrane protein